ncbi:MAG TPA: DUF1599 domain-containing protein [Chitinophagaceae bacterium]|nr:DUF1599 domain-containing protein [Chitinophagaceae bacterium]
MIGFSITSNLPLQFRVNIRLCSLLLKLKIERTGIQRAGSTFEMDMTTMIKMTGTNQQYDEAINTCKDIFVKKARDYGTAWRVLRTISIVDQIFIKAQRIRTIQEKKEQKIADDVASEFRGIINYAVIGLIQLDLPEDAPEEMNIDEVSMLYDKKISMAKSLMENKNHDYGEAWRTMSQQSFVDLILMKLQRIRQILNNEGKTLVSEGIDANYVDIINYGVFALILM